MINYFITSNYPIFFNLLIKNSSYYSKLNSRLEKLKKINEPALSEIEASINRRKYSPTEEKIEEVYCSCIIFAGLLLETYIYDYAILNLQKNYVDKHLDKLDTISKYLIIPKLITGKSISKEKDSQVYNSISLIVKSRNSIVHSKSNVLWLKNVSHLPNFTEILTNFTKGKEIIEIDTLLDRIKIISEKLMELDDRLYLYPLYITK